MAKSNTKTVLVTGASSGIGEATAFYLATKGYKVIGTSRDKNRLINLKDQSKANGNEVDIEELDINSETSVTRAIHDIKNKYGHIDVLVNNAAYGLWGPAQTFSMKELRSQFETNFFGTFLMCKTILPYMLQKERGTIINISSVLGKISTPFNGGYAATKFALEGLSEAMRFELWPFGIRIVLVEPGLFKTNFKDNQIIAAKAECSEFPYIDLISNYRNKRKSHEFLSKNPISVAKVIHKIVRSKNPRFRYKVGIETILGTLGSNILPERIYQSIISRTYMN